MSAKILDGKKIASKIKDELRSEVLHLQEKGVIPGLAVILVGDDAASKIYVKNKKKACEEIGINSQVFEMAETTSEEELLKLIQKLNQDNRIHGILVQLPLPGHINEGKIIEAIDPKKDVDCFHPYNVGRMSIGIGDFFPCTPAGIIEILKRNNIEISGKECMVVGASNIVGKPMAMMLLKENGTVTIANRETKNLAEITKRADVLIVAVGNAGLIKKDMVKKEAAVVDVGMNRLPNGKLVGDVDFENVKEIAGAITPVPGGVGPVTVAMLLKNTIISTNYESGMNVPM